MNSTLLSTDASRSIATLTAAVVTIATFAKSFVPFYLIGSTPIFIVACLVGIVLISLRWRETLDNASYATDFLILLAALYAVVAANFLFKSSQVPLTYLVGILAFHGLFVLFGFAAARKLNAVFAILLAQAAVFLIFIVQYTLRFGDPMAHGYLGDVFGVQDDQLYIAFHVNIGTALGIAVLAALGMAAGRARLAAYAAVPLTMWLMFHIASRTALVALLCSLVFLAWAALWGRSKRSALMIVALLGISALLITGPVYRYALGDKAVDPKAPDAISRTLREIQLQNQNPGLRLPIWNRTLQRIVTEPDRLLFGRGVGAFPIDEGFGPPNWLLRPTQGSKHYPHDLYLEMLYEVGLVGLLPFIALTLFPLASSLRHWASYSAPERSAVLIYVFYFVTVQISGSFALSYDFQFFLGLAIGIIALRRKSAGYSRLDPVWISRKKVAA